MNTAIPLIQLTLRVEREAEAQRRAYMADEVERVEEKSVRLPELALRLRRVYTPLYCQPQRQCA
ncbi:MAG TPA: hypothetical protein PKZ84_17625 [Anaerolineae bacterium]|nr:hypothetical protein [Anaerolineae bacterium]HQI86394.1 hypothetical protein [Anaerolineae bacterium]